MHFFHSFIRFISCIFPNTFFQIINFIKIDILKDLILLKVDTLKLDHLVWEQASDGNMFPHLYSPLNLSNVTDEFEILLQDDGSHKLPDSY